MTLGIEPVSWGNESAVLKMNITERLHNGSGFLQGGFYVILADEAIALAVLAELSENEGLSFQREIMGATTGTDADEICVSRGGVRTALISIPQRYMHTPVEVADIRDIENCAKLIAEFLERV